MEGKSVGKIEAEETRKTTSTHETAFLSIFFSLERPGESSRDSEGTFPHETNGQRSFQLTQMDGESSPLDRRGVEVSVVDVEVSRGHCLRSETVEEGDFGATRDANCGERRTEINKLKIVKESIKKSGRGEAINYSICHNGFTAAVTSKETSNGSDCGRKLNRGIGRKESNIIYEC